MERGYTVGEYLKSGRTDARGDSGDCALDRHHRRLPRRGRDGLPRHARADGGGALRLGLQLQVFAAREHARIQARRHGRRRREGPAAGRGDRATGTRLGGAQSRARRRAFRGAGRGSGAPRRRDARREDAAIQDRGVSGGRFDKPGRYGDGARGIRDRAYAALRGASEPSQTRGTKRSKKMRDASSRCLHLSAPNSSAIFPGRRPPAHRRP